MLEPSEVESTHLYRAKLRLNILEVLFAETPSREKWFGGI